MLVTLSVCECSVLLLPFHLLLLPHLTLWLANCVRILFVCVHYDAVILFPPLLEAILNFIRDRVTPSVA